MGDEKIFKSPSGAMAPRAMLDWFAVLDSRGPIVQIRRARNMDDGGYVRSAWDSIGEPQVAVEEGRHPRSHSRILVDDAGTRAVGDLADWHAFNDWSRKSFLPGGSTCYASDGERTSSAHTR
jgi:hypothetical protein